MEIDMGERISSMTRDGLGFFSLIRVVDVVNSCQGKCRSSGEETEWSLFCSL
jgi:hypothetical protein